MILLGLGLSQLLGGLASAVKRRPGLKIGWGTGLLATWVTTETVIFWEIIWGTRNGLPFNGASLFAGLVVTALYYFAGALVFPDDLADRKSLDDYFMAEKWRVISAVLAAVTLSFALRWVILRDASFSTFTWFDWASIAIIYLAGPMAILTKRREVAIACLALLVVVDLLEPVGSLLWPHNP
ncbi:MAG: hypothetical protein H0W71_04225 [Sphingomonas sp.]|nr:hypothetical protein [Sphingomonas sp.]